MSTIVETSAGRDRTSKGGKFLTFFLAGEEYGVEILKVHEIIGIMPITRVPCTPAFVRGVINLRGKVIPIVDMRQKFGMPPGGVDESCVIVVQVRGIQIGVVVDAVSEVLNIASGEIEATPSFGVEVNTDFLLGLAKTDGKVRLLLDIERVLSSPEIDELEAVRVEA